MIPIQCEYLALEGLGKLLNTIKSIQKLHNKELSIEGLLLTMYDTRLNLSNQVKKEVKLHFNEMVFNKGNYFKKLIMAKATKKQVLGRGLTSILKDSKNKASTISKIKTNYSTEIEISKIILNPFQPRSAFNKEKLEELIISIKKKIIKK